MIVNFVKHGTLSQLSSSVFSVPLFLITIVYLGQGSRIVEKHILITCRTGGVVEVLGVFIYPYSEYSLATGSRRTKMALLFALYFGSNICPIRSGTF